MLGDGRREEEVSVRKYGRLKLAHVIAVGGACQKHVNGLSCFFHARTRV